MPPPIHYTTTIHDPPMQIPRDSSRFTSQQNLNYSLGNPLNSEGSWSLLDNISLYNKLFDNDTTSTANVNKDDREEEVITRQKKKKKKFSF